MAECIRGQQTSDAERLRKALVPRIAVLSSAATRPEHVLWVWLATQYLGEMLRGEPMTGEHRQGELWARYGQETQKECDD